jgi:hypothetical protein
MSVSKQQIEEYLKQGMELYASKQSDKYGAVFHLACTLLRFEIIDKTTCRSIKGHYYEHFNPF